MTRRRAPRSLGPALTRLADDLAPRTGLADVQRVWKDAVGDAVAAQAHPVAERAGAVTVRCSSAVWAQELDLMGPELVGRLNAGSRSPACDRSAVPGRGDASVEWEGGLILRDLQEFCDVFQGRSGARLCYCSVNQMCSPRPGSD